MIMYHITIGLNDQYTKNQIMDAAAARQKISRILLHNFRIPGFTLIECYGCYTHSDGSVCNEKSIRIEIAADYKDRQMIYTVSRALRRIFNQESIMIESYNANITF